KLVLHNPDYFSWKTTPMIKESEITEESEGEGNNPHPIIGEESKGKVIEMCTQGYLRVLSLGSQRTDVLMTSDWEHAFRPSVK
ncbi:hypothetical protein AVEN_131853-1, partial [Araneus ventricosus]